MQWPAWSRGSICRQAAGQRFGARTPNITATDFTNKNLRQQAMTPTAFNAWTDMVRAKGIPMTATAYGIIRQRSTLNDMRHALSADQMPAGVLYFRDVPSDLFHNIVRSFHGGPSVITVLRARRGAKAE